MWRALARAPLLSLLTPGLPLGIWRLASWGYFRLLGRQAWWDERWLAIYPFGWLDEATHRPSYHHGGGALKRHLLVVDGSEFFDRTWLTEEVARAWLKPLRMRQFMGPTRRHWARGQVYARVRATRVASAATGVAGLLYTWRTLGGPALTPFLNPWPDGDWALDLANGPDVMIPQLRAVLDPNIKYPLHSPRGIPAHLEALRAWVEPELDLAWAVGLGRTGPINGQRRPLPLPLTRDIASRHRSWRVDSQ